MVINLSMQPLSSLAQASVVSISPDLRANERSVTLEPFTVNLTVDKAEGSKQISPATSSQVRACLCNTI